MDLRVAMFLAALVGMVYHEHFTVVIMGTSTWEMVPDNVLILDLGVAMLLAALVTLFDHEHITVVIMSTSS